MSVLAINEGKSHFRVPPLQEDSPEWIALGQLWPKDHHAAITELVVGQLDVEALRASYAGVGSKGWLPELMLRLAVFETLRNRPSPADWARDVAENEAVRWLLRGCTPSQRCCYRFRDRISDHIKELHDQLVQQALAEFSLQPKVVAQDGTMHRAAASRHHLVNSVTLNKRHQALLAMIQVDLNGGDPPDDYLQSMPKTPSGRLDLLKRMEKAQNILNLRLEQNQKKKSSDRLDPKHVFVSLSDPEAAVSRDKEKVFGPLYTTQYLVDFETTLILDYKVEARATDAGTLAPMLDSAQQVVGGTIELVVVDGSYATILDLRDCKERGVQLIGPIKSEPASKRFNRSEFQWLDDEKTYQCPAGHLLKYLDKEKMQRACGRTLTRLRFRCPPDHCMGCSLAPGCVKTPANGRTVTRLEGQELLDEHNERMEHPDAKTLLRYRGSVVELAFADTKEYRGQRKMHGRGTSRVNAQVGLATMTRNMMTIFRMREDAQTLENAA